MLGCGLTQSEWRPNEQRWSIRNGPLNRADVEDPARDQIRKNVTALDNLKQQATRIFRRHRHRIPASA